LILQVLLKYNMQRGVVVIPKASSPEHLAANLQDMFSWRLNNQQKVRTAAACFRCLKQQQMHTVASITCNAQHAVACAAVVSLECGCPAATS
jgi:diketogulonate reductase-like aldo/keto reductase